MTRGPVLIGGIQHETNSFSPLKTNLSDFQTYQYALGEEVIERYRGTGTELGGMIEAASQSSLSLMPTVFAAATPSGMVERSTFTRLCDQLCDVGTRDADRGGAIIALHGAMVVDGYEQADGVILQAMRARLGDAPIVATLDYHANISSDMVAAADMLISYDTFPHTDMAPRGRDAMRVLAARLGGRARPGAAFRKLPLLPASAKQVTERRPMLDVMAAVRQARTEEGIWSCSVLAGFPYADVPHLGMSVLAYGEQAAADRVADRLAAMIWQRREDFTTEITPLGDAVSEAITSPAPVILVDPADNVGGGAPGDSTAILNELLARGANGAVVVIWDPTAAALASRLGRGGTFGSSVGAHTGKASGEPVELLGTVTFAKPVQYTRTGSYMPGTVVDMGVVAIVEVGGNQIVLTSERIMPFDTDHLTVLGIEPGRQRIIVVKSGSAWRAAFGDIAKTVVHADAPGVCAQRFTQLPYSQPQRPLFPIDHCTKWPE